MRRGFLSFANSTTLVENGNVYPLSALQSPKFQVVVTAQLFESSCHLALSRLYTLRARMHYSPTAGKLLWRTPNPSSPAWSAKFSCLVVGWDLGTSYQWLASASNTGVGAFSTTSEANTVAVCHPTARRCWDHGQVGGEVITGGGSLPYNSIGGVTVSGEIPAQLSPNSPKLLPESDCLVIGVWVNL